MDMTLCTELFVEKSRYHNSTDDREHRHHLHNAVTPRQAGFWHSLGQDAVFTRSKHGTLCGHQKKNDPQKSRTSAEHSKESSTHNPDLNELCPLKNFLFAYAIGQSPEYARKYDEWDCENHARVGRNFLDRFSVAG